MSDRKAAGLQEVLPKAGLVVSEKGNLTELLCKPKIMQLKSITLQKLEEMEAQLLQPLEKAPEPVFSAAAERPMSAAGPSDGRPRTRSSALPAFGTPSYGTDSFADLRN